MAFFPTHTNVRRFGPSRRCHFFFIIKSKLDIVSILQEVVGSVGSHTVLQTYIGFGVSNTGLDYI